MEELLNNKKQIRFSGYGISHQNGTAELTINVIVTMEITMLMHAALTCPKVTLSTDFGQQKWSILYISKVRSMICSMVYKI